MWLREQAGAELPQSHLHLSARHTRLPRLRGERWCVLRAALAPEVLGAVGRGLQLRAFLDQFCVLGKDVLSLDFLNCKRRSRNYASSFSGSSEDQVALQGWALASPLSPDLWPSLRPHKKPCATQDTSVGAQMRQWRECALENPCTLFKCEVILGAVDLPPSCQETSDF